MLSSNTTQFAGSKTFSSTVGAEPSLGDIIIIIIIILFLPYANTSFLAIHSNICYQKLEMQNNTARTTVAK